MTEKEYKNDNLKKILWDAADMLRGNMDASEYKQIFLGLIFLKYISERFERKYQELAGENAGFETSIDEYTSCGVYYIPREARWHAIMEHCGQPDLGEYIDFAIQRIEDANSDLKGILPKYFSRTGLDMDRLSQLIFLFDANIDTQTDRDTLGMVYEYCLMKFAEQEGKRAGEFYTPSSIIKTLVRSLDLQGGRLYDPCCGSGGMFIYADREIRKQGGTQGDLSFYGQDSNPTTWKMCLMNLAVHGIEADVGRHNADTFLQDLHPELKADYILASPPFNMSEWGAERLWNDKRWQYGMPPAGNANYAWIQHMIYHLAPKGRMGIVLSNGTLTTQTSGEGEIRRNLVERDLIECIVAMPGNLFYNTGIPVSLWFINKAKRGNECGKILFVDAREMGHTAGRSQRELDEKEIHKISEKICAYRSGADSYYDEPGFCVAADLEEIRQNDFSLVPGRYVAMAEPEINENEIAGSLRDLTGELMRLMHENHRLERELEEKLREIGYEI
ncbi:MAG: class I SAM-dependent DNA methyltransferase [Lachnospiraceae bacterium]|nr:class I SAM-dependent DNA methyltransferase [Lachnospiraceae bacterium]